MASRTDSDKSPALNDDEAAWLMAISQVLTLQDMFEVVPELLEHILTTRRDVPAALAHQMHDAIREDGLHKTLATMISLSRQANKE